MNYPDLLAGLSSFANVCRDDQIRGLGGLLTPGHVPPSHQGKAFQAGKGTPRAAGRGEGDGLGKASQEHQVRLKGRMSSVLLLLRAVDPSRDISAGGDLHINISIPPGFPFQPFPK